MDTKVDKEFFKDRYEVVFTIGDNHHNWRVDQFLKTHFLSFSREFIKKKIAKLEVQLKTRDCKLKPSTHLVSNDCVWVVCNRETLENEFWNNQLIPFDEELEVIENHPDYMVINKPPYMCAHPTGRHVFYCATVYASREFHVETSAAHRLDRETSGILLLTKNPIAAKLFSQLFEHHQVQKFYLLVAHTSTSELLEEFCAHERLGEPDESASRLHMHTFPASDTRGKSAETYFYLLERAPQFAVYLAMPKTGRQHQIRAHASHHGLPLIGDKLYGLKPTLFHAFKDGLATKEDHDLMIMPRQALHAAALYIPKTQYGSHFWFAPLPQDMEKLLREIMPELNLETFYIKIQTVIKIKCGASKDTLSPP
jgi:RluA family pseudouridine synthase